MRHASSAALASVVFLTGCVSAMDDPSLTPAERLIRQRNAQYNQTIGAGALTGALLGAGIGALAGGGKGAMIGGLSGLALGAGTGYWVAERTQSQQMTEDDLLHAISDAQRDATQSEESAQAARNITQQARVQLTTLNAQYRAHQITAQQYQEQTRHFQENARQLQTLAATYRKNAASMRQTAHNNISSDTAQVLDETAATELSSAKTLEQEGKALTALSAMAPPAQPLGS
ncbi:hypothetical protein [Oecophyllibacter saccharovorans]|uniref:hypothetical protein n=1 Tax=Oecophyllibacter saccharovorans TaxID=2558360 RepID=UPI00188470D1|nr:hypothetical protein [Oecophyllibacter saccharovorans]